MKPHHVLIKRHLIDRIARVPWAGSLSMCKRYAEGVAANTNPASVAIETNRGTTWRLKDGRWVHDTGRKG